MAKVILRKLDTQIGQLDPDTFFPSWAHCFIITLEISRKLRKRKKSQKERKEIFSTDLISDILGYFLESETYYIIQHCSQDSFSYDSKMSLELSLGALFSGGWMIP